MLIDLFSANIAYASFGTILSSINKLIINPLIILLFALALFFFLYGVMEFISNQTNEEKKVAGKQHMIWGVIGLTIMMGVWFLMNVVISTFGIRGITIDDKGNNTVKLDSYDSHVPDSGR